MQVRHLLVNDADEIDLLKGAAAGVVGGLLASLMMEQFQALWMKSAKSFGGRKSGRSKPTTVKVADLVSKKITGHRIPRGKQELAGEAVHYAMGATSGAVYGLVSELTPLATFGDGLVFGSAVFVLADEVSLPLLGLSKSPGKIPWLTHVYAFASHLVYGWTTELVRRAVRKAM